MLHINQFEVNHGNLVFFGRERRLKSEAPDTRLSVPPVSFEVVAILLDSPYGLRRNQSDYFFHPFFDELVFIHFAENFCNLAKTRAFPPFIGMK